MAINQGDVVRFRTLVKFGTFMKIFHIGGYCFETTALAEVQRRAGHDVKTIAVSDEHRVLSPVPFPLQTLSSNAEVLTFSPDVIHFHTAESLGFGRHGTLPSDAADTLRCLKEQSAALIYSSGPTQHRNSAGQNCFPEQALMNSFDCVIIQNAFFQPASEKAASILSQGVPLPLHLLPCPPPTELKKPELRIIHIPDDEHPRDIEPILEGIATLRRKHLKLQFQVIPREELSDLSSIIRALNEADIFIERLSGGLFSHLALLGLALGKTVLSSLSPESKQAFNPLQFCPVFDTTKDNLCSRLESLFREPKSLRDLGKRGRQYVESHHSAAKIGDLLLQVYWECSNNKRQGTRSSAQ